MKRAAPVLLCLALAALAWAGNGITGYGQSYASGYISSTAATSLSDTNPALVAGTWTALDKSSDWTVSAAGRYTYTGAETRAFVIVVHMSAETDAAGANDLAGITVAKGGSSIAATHVDRKLGAASDHGAFGTTYLDGSVETNEYFEVMIEIDDATGTPDVTADHCIVTITGAAR